MTTRDDIQVYEMVESISNQNIHRIGECATTCIAHPLSPLAGVAYMDVGEGREQDAEALRIAAIAHSRLISSRHARDKMECTLQAVQLRIPG